MIVKFFYPKDLLSGIIIHNILRSFAGILLFSFFILFNLQTTLFSADGYEQKKKIEFKSLDGLLITADLYFNGDTNKKFILLFHQAASSRGEYNKTALQLYKMGFNSMAIDQRSGQEINRIVNQTAKRAFKKNFKTHYLSAEMDISSAIEYAKKKLKVKRLLLWGSSYSASLVLKIAGEAKYKYTGVVAFSPGEYFGKSNFITNYAQKIQVPVWITCAKREIKRTRKLFNVIPSKKKIFFQPKNQGAHGSKALWKNNPGYKQYRKSLYRFLRSL